MDFVFDDSGGYKSSDFIAIAGYVASSDGWGLCSEAWGFLLAKHGIPYIHMKDLVPLQGPYKNLGWSTRHRDAVLLEFADAIRKYSLMGFAVALDVREFRKLPSDAKHVLGNPHSFCVARLVRLIRLTLESINSEPPHTLIFDDSEEFSVMYHGVVRDLRKQPEYRQLFGSVCFADDELYFPLQAADILAWESAKYLYQKAGGFKPRPEFAQLVALDQPEILFYKSELYDKLALEDAYRKAPPRL